MSYYICSIAVYISEFFHTNKIQIRDKNILLKIVLTKIVFLKLTVRHDRTGRKKKHRYLLQHNL